MDIIRISRAAVSRAGLVKTASVEIRLGRVIQAARGMVKTADTGSNWGSTIRSAGVIRPAGTMKAFAVAAPPPVPKNEFGTKPNNVTSVKVTPYETANIDSLMREQNMNNQANAQAAVEAQENANKELGARNYENGSWVKNKNDGTIKHEFDLGHQSAQHARHGLTGWWDRNVTKNTWYNPRRLQWISPMAWQAHAVNYALNHNEGQSPIDYWRSVNSIGGDEATAKLNKDIRHGKVIDKRKWYQQLGFGDPGKQEQAGTYRVADMGSYQAPDGYKWLSTGTNAQGDVVQGWRTFRREYDDNQNPIMADADVAYDRERRAKNMVEGWGMAGSKPHQEAMKELIDRWAGNRADANYYDQATGKWTGAGLNALQQDAQYQALHNAASRIDNFDSTAFRDALLGEAANSLYKGAVM